MAGLARKSLVPGRPGGDAFFPSNVGEAETRRKSYARVDRAGADNRMMSTSAAPAEAAHFIFGMRRKMERSGRDLAFVARLCTREPRLRARGGRLAHVDGR